METIQYPNTENCTHLLKVDDKVFTLNQIYPYIYDYGKGKEVLRLEISESAHTFDEILYLIDTTSELHHFKKYEDGTEVEVIAYDGYHQDFVCNYKDGIYSIELTRISATDRKVIELEQQLEQTNATTDYLLMIADMDTMEV